MSGGLSLRKRTEQLWPFALCLQLPQFGNRRVLFPLAHCREGNSEEVGNRRFVLSLEKLAQPSFSDLGHGDAQLKTSKVGKSSTLEGWLLKLAL